MPNTADPLGLQALGVLLTALGLSSVSGLRAYFPLLAMAVASDIPTGNGQDLITLSKPFQALGTWWVVALLVALVLGEFTVDKIPVIDHVSDLFHTIVRPLSGAIIMAAVSNPLSEQNVWAAAVVGAALALTVHATKAASRPAVTATTAGLGNPVVSVAEDGIVAVVSVLAVLASFLGAALLVLAAVVGWLVYLGVKKLGGRRPQPGVAAPSGAWPMSGGRP
jgi:Domain of unknown function (DUF4126)